MQVISTANMQTRRGPADWFTGTVWMESATVPQPGTGIHKVFFEPGARTNWHTHPEGQVLHVITGEGRVQKEDEPAIAIGPGDVVHIAPDEKHWHGADPNTYMVHLAISPANATSGETNWLEPVTDEQYAG
jgi:quercetin dioxygenase-like cupin family protein